MRVEDAQRDLQKTPPCRVPLTAYQLRPSLTVMLDGSIILLKKRPQKRPASHRFIASVIKGNLRMPFCLRRYVQKASIYAFFHDPTTQVDVSEVSRH